MYVARPHILHAHTGLGASLNGQVCFRTCVLQLHPRLGHVRSRRALTLQQRLLVITRAKKAAKQNKKPKKKAPIDKRIVIGTRSLMLHELYFNNVLQSI